MNIGGLLGALLPVFFVLALGYVAGKRNAFDADPGRGIEQACAVFRAAGFFVCQHDGHPQRPSSSTGTSCCGIDSCSCRPFCGRSTLPGRFPIAQWAPIP